MKPNQSNDEKVRYFLAILLSLGVLLVWTFFSNPNLEENNNGSDAPQPKVTAQGKSDEKADSQSSETTTNDEQSIFITEENKAETPTPSDLGSGVVLEEDRRVNLEGEDLKLQFSTKNAVVVEAYIKYENDGEMITSENIENSLPKLATGKVAFKLEDQDPEDRYYQVVSESGKEITFRSRVKIQKKEFFIEKTYVLDGYRLGLDVKFYDEAGESIKLNYYLINGSKIGIKKKEQNIFDITELSYTIGEDTETVLSRGFFSIFGEEKSLESLEINPDWIAIDNRFFARVLKTEGKSEKIVFLRKNANNDEYLAGAYKLISGDKNSFTFYFLPKKRDLLDKFYNDEKEFFFNLFHQFKFMRILSSMLYFLIQEIFFVVHDYGWSILIITLLLKLIILPLTQKSMKSMKRMQELSPKMQAIRSNFKNNPQKMNAEMMNLYRKEKINPLGGCIPMLIPLPIFIAFYSLFRSMVELQGVSFLWIDDLSLPDVIYTFGFDLPLIGDELHLLPIVMTFSAFLQSMLTPQTTTPENRQQVLMMKYFLPVFFLFISWSMPSALILFWMTQNIFSIGQMLFIRIFDKQKKNLVTAK